MAEDTGGDKSLPASAQKKQRAREDGNVAKSADLSSSVSLLTALGALMLLGPMIFAGMIAVGRDFLGHAHELIPNAAPIEYTIQRALYAITLMTLPFMLVMLISGVAVNMLQIGPLLTSKPLVPKLDRINPISGFQRFFSLRSFVELIKSLAKLALVTYLAWLAIEPRLEHMYVLMELTPAAQVPVLADFVFAIWWRVALAMLVLGLADYGFQFWQRERDLRMTVQEARQEMKEMEGDPLIKRRIRQLQRQMATQRMMREVPTAEVVITNPIEFAVALRYNAAEMDAPVVIAKGRRLIAARIREIAVENHVPIVEKPEVARALYAAVEIGQPIPGTLFRAVAEILSYVYQIDRRAEKLRERDAAFAPQRAAV